MYNKQRNSKAWALVNYKRPAMQLRKKEPDGKPRQT